MLGAQQVYSTPRRRRVLVLAVSAVLLTTALAVVVQSAQASGSAITRCGRFRAESAARAAVRPAAGTPGQRVVVIGDSWSAGLGLRDPATSWPASLPGRVRVAGFSGSGFSEEASPCGRVSFADRAPAAVRRGADLVVVEGGLNDVDQPDGAIVEGFDRLMQTLRGHRVVVVGPAAAPSRARGVPRVDALLSRLSARHQVAYIRTDDLRLPYLADRLHLTPAGHRAFGRAVAARLP